MNFIQSSFVLCIYTVLFMMVTETQSQAMAVANSEIPGHPGLCFFDDPYSSEENKITFFLKPGQKRKHPKNCFRIDCSETLGLSVTGCGIGASQNHCRYIKGDNSRPYPRCCGELVC